MFLEEFKPEHVVRHLKKICEIPHVSEHEEELCNYIKDIAKKNEHEYFEDETGNLIVYVKASPGYEEVAPFLLQAHMDMVAEKSDDSNHDFIKDPIKLKLVDGQYLYADGTTLGADNAVGMMNMLALMEDDTVIHPPLEMLFTVCEENGLKGIRKVDFSRIKSRRMINMDCGDPDVMCVSTAGAAQCLVKKSLEYSLIDDVLSYFTIKISGLQGGHAGLMIDKGHYSGVTAMGRILCGLISNVELNLLDVNCDRTSGIVNEIEAKLAVSSGKTAEFLETFENIKDLLIKEYLISEPELKICIEKWSTEKRNKVISFDCSKKIAALLYVTPYGVIKRDYNDKDTILCSNNTMQVNIVNDCFEMDMMVRAPEDIAKEDLVAKIRIISQLCGAEFTVTDSFAGWPYRKNSPLQELCQKTYFELVGEKLKVEKHNSCAETGIIAGEIKDMDIVALAPLGRGAHTYQEHLDMTTVEPFWKFLTKLLEKMCIE